METLNDTQREAIEVANAHLTNVGLPAYNIAAPDLLAALDQLLRVTVDSMLADGYTLSDQEERARQDALAAIAKATMPQ